MVAATEHSHIVSSTPKRTRIRVSAKRRTPEELARLAEALSQSPKVNEVSVNEHTGTIVVQHEDKSLGDIFTVMRDLGVILKLSTNIDIPTSDGNTMVANQLANAVADLNQRLGFATDGFVNLRVLVPVGLGAMALVQLLRRGLQFEAAPWYFLAYAAFDSFVKLHDSCEISPKPAAQVQQPVKS
jgi:flagellar basal body P-ring protein FlgI